ncbi:hypothetical protein Taro_014366, partial [Colocasia esculenta]|nr:hypothetical protein [Colocasia esculenta]
MGKKLRFLAVLLLWCPSSFSNDPNTMELDGKLAAIKIFIWRQHRVSLTPVGGKPFAVKFFRFFQECGFDLCTVYTDLVIDSVDTPIDGVDTGSESLKLFHEDRVKCVDTVPSSVDTRPSLQKTQLPDWDSVSTQPVAVVKCVDTVPGSVDTRPSLQKTQLPDWDSVSTQPVAVSTLDPSPRRSFCANGI